MIGKNFGHGILYASLSFTKMTAPLISPSYRRQTRSGFALVIALSLMAFVLLLLLSITTLVQVETRSAQISIKQLRAEQNALLGLNVALGELQKYAGRDQTVTARADLIANGSASGTNYYTGVWAWDPDAETQTFSKWLASVADASGQLDPTGLTNEADVNTAFSALDRIVLQTTLGRPADDVVVDQVSIGTDGSYAFWVSDEGVKAKVNLLADEDYYQALASGDVEDLDLRGPLGAAPGIGFELLDNVFDTLMLEKRTDADFRGKLRKLASTDDFELLGAAEAAVSLLQPDVTTYSYGLLTNPKTGGLKQDLSLAFEHENKDSGNVFVEEGYAHPDGAMDVKGPSWAVFQDHYNIYKQVEFTSSGIPELQTTLPQAHGNLNSAQAEDFYRFITDYHQPMKDPVVYERPILQSDNADKGFDMPRAESVQVGPVFLGYVVIVSLKIDSTTNKLVTILQPVALLWNPYNVALETSEEIKVRANMIFGLEFGFHDSVEGFVYKGRARVGDLWAESDPTIDINRNFSGVDLIISSNESFAPGEIKLYSSDTVMPTASSLSAADEIGGSETGYHVTSWRKLSDAPAEPGLGTASYDDVKVSNIEPDGMIVEPTVTEIDLAISPLFANRDLSGLYFDTGGDIRTKSYYQKRHIVPLLLEDGEYSGNPIGTFSSSDDGKQGIGFLNLGIDKQALIDNAQTVGIIFCTANSSQDINNGLRTPSAMELHLSSNPRAPFSSSTVGTYAHFNNNPNTIYEAQEYQGDPVADYFFDDKHPYFGMSYDTYTGQQRPVAWEFPLSPLTSLAQLQHVFFNRDSYEPSYAVGNSFASPYLRRHESISTVDGVDLRLEDGSLPIGGKPLSYQGWKGSAIDYSYKLNDALWDDYYFSSLAPVYEDGTEVQNLDDTIDAFVSGAQGLQNSRMQLHLGVGDVPRDLATDWKSTNPDKSEKKLAANLLVEGAFNVNSTSVQAWKAFLGSLYEQDVVGMELGDPDAGADSDLQLNATPEGAVFSRLTLPTLDKSHPSDPTDIQNNPGSGYRVLDADELNVLAEKVVEQVKLRGPFHSLSDFVNRDLSDGPEGLMGPLQQAINDAELNDDVNALGLTVNKGGNSPTPFQHDIFLDPEAGTGSSYGAGPGYLLQGDILNSLGPFLTVKSNTFVIRTCGEWSDPVSGESSRVYLEAVVQQLPDFVDSSDAAETALDDLLSVANQQFGRQFKVVQLRRLDPDQI